VSRTIFDYETFLEIVIVFALFPSQRLHFNVATDDLVHIQNQVPNLLESLLTETLGIY
jgi:hypothetical protein